MKNLFSYWHIDTGLMIFIIILCLLYLYMLNFKFQKKTVYFFTGLLFLIIALTSPLHFLGMNYLFSAHMITHIILLLISAPLMVMGIPEESRFKKYLIFFSMKLHAFPFLCWLAGVGIMWFWHIPSVFNKMFDSHNMMQANHSMSAFSFFHVSTLLLSGILFSWPVINPYVTYRIAPLSGVLYLSTACIFCSLLGLLLTFAPIGTYHYITAMDHYGYLSVIRNQWGISSEMDQQMAGMIMWVPCCFIYLSGAMFLLKKWFNEKEESISLPASVSLLNNN